MQIGEFNLFFYMVYFLLNYQNNSEQRIKMG